MRMPLRGGSLLRAGLGRAWGVGSTALSRPIMERWSDGRYRTISGCSGDDFLRWQEQESAAAAAAAEADRAAGPAGPGGKRSCAADAATARAAEPAPAVATGGASAAAPRLARASDSGEMSESLSRNLERARARWKAMRGGRR